MKDLILNYFESSSNETEINNRILISVELMWLNKLKTGEWFILSESSNNNNFVVGIGWPNFNAEDNEIFINSTLSNSLKLGETVNLTPLNIDKVNKLKNLTLLTKVKFNKNLKNYLTQVIAGYKFIIFGQVIEFKFEGTVYRVEVVGLKFTQNDNMDDDDIYAKLGLFNADSKLEIEEFEVKKEVKEEDEVDPFTKVGGLKEQLELVKRVVDIPLNKPETFTNYNLKPPRGLLLFGPPGTGKSLLAQAAAKHSKATLFTVNGPELVSKFVGETEAKIREIFEKAREKEPSIILIDEIDSICPNRDDAQNELDKRVVATFLTLLDGASSDEHGKFHRIVVIGTTNRVQSIDPALRRPGRFDIEVEIGIPSPEDRYDILKTLLNSVNHNLTDDFIKSISDKSHGYVGADLSAVVKEAGLSAIQRKIKNPTEEDLIISESDIIETIGKIKPSAMREVSVKVPKVLWSDIGGHHHVRHKLKESVEWPLKHPEVFTRFNIKPPKGILLYGPPGCSKTLMAKALATEAGINFILVKGPELFNKWVGESEKAVKEVFRKARAAAPSIVFFDEMDALTVKRGNDGDTSSVADRVLSQILTEMDGLDSLVNVTVVGATNRPDIMDPALLRPGRMDRILYIGPPNYEARLEIFNIQSRKMPFSDDINIEYLSEKTDGCSGAEVVALCQEAAMNSLQRDLNTQNITSNDFELALQKLIKRITPEMLEFYHNYASTSGMKQV